MLRQQPMLMSSYNNMGTEACSTLETRLEKHTVEERTREGCQP